MRRTKSKKKYRKMVNIISNYKTSRIVITILNYASVEFSLECIPVDQSRELIRAQLAMINYNGE